VDDAAYLMVVVATAAACGLDRKDVLRRLLLLWRLVKAAAAGIVTAIENTRDTERRNDRMANISFPWIRQEEEESGKDTTVR
jgi:hypothetical protein